MNRTELLERKSELIKSIDNANTEEELRKIDFDLNKIAMMLKNCDDTVSHEYEGDDSNFINKGAMNKKSSDSELLGSIEYRKAFKDFVQTGKVSEILMRADSNTSTGDIGKLIPNTVSTEIIKGIKYSTVLYPRVRKLNVQGGLEFPISALKPSARWVGENDKSESQKLDVNSSIKFTYHMLECEMAQTLLSKIVSLDAFESLMIENIKEAMEKKLDIDIMNGTGVGQMLGIIKDTRIEAAQKRSITEADLSKWVYFKSLVSDIPSEYRSNTTLIMAQGTWNHIDNLQDSTGQPIARVNYGINGEEIHRFAGREVLIVSDDVLPSFDNANVDDTVIACLNLNDYAINTNYQLAYDSYEEKRNHLIYNRALMVCDGKLLDSKGTILVKKKA